MAIILIAFLAPAIRADDVVREHPRASDLLLDGAPGASGGTDRVSNASNCSPTNAPAYVQFEESPRKVDIFQLQQMQLKAAEIAGRSQRRITVPPGAMAPQSTINPTVAVANDEPSPASAAPHFHPNPTANRICLGVLLAGIGCVAARKYLPWFH